jgi:hypothetical protein
MVGNELRLPERNWFDSSEEILTFGKTDQNLRVSSPAPNILTFCSITHFNQLRKSD